MQSWIVSESNNVHHLLKYMGIHVSCFMILIELQIIKISQADVSHIAFNFFLVLN